MIQPFLEVLTRCYKRPVMLTCNRRSLTGQTSSDWAQTLLVDEVGQGIAESYRRMGKYAPNLIGRYVWILDDDDECARFTLLAELKRIWEDHDPDVIMVRMEHGVNGQSNILPDASHWQRTDLQRGDLGVSAFIVRRELWQKHAPVMVDQAAYAADFDFISAILADQPRVYWHDVVASRVQRVSLGIPE